MPNTKIRTKWIHYIYCSSPVFYLPLRTTAALLTVPHTLTLHLIIAQILFYSFSIDQDVEPPSILLSLHCLTLTFLLFQDLLIVLRCLLRQHDSIHHSSDAHFLGIIAQVGITQHLRQSTELRIGQLSRHFGSAIVRLQHSLSINQPTL